MNNKDNVRFSFEVSIVITTIILVVVYWICRASGLIAGSEQIILYSSLKSTMETCSLVEGSIDISGTTYDYSMEYNPAGNKESTIDYSLQIFEAQADSYSMTESEYYTSTYKTYTSEKTGDKPLTEWTSFWLIDKGGVLTVTYYINDYIEDSSNIFDIYNSCITDKLLEYKYVSK